MYSQVLVGVSPSRVLVKLAGQERTRETRESSEIMKGKKKSEEVGFKARKKLITRKRDCSTRVERSRADDCGGVVCVRSKGT